MDTSSGAVYGRLNITNTSVIRHKSELALMRQVLVVEDSPMVVKILKHVFASSDLFRCVYVSSLVEAKQHISACAEGIFAAVVDLNLPDSQDGELVDYCLAQGIPTLVLTASFDEQRRATLLAKGIVDYVTKEGRFSYNYVLGVLTRLVKNQHIKVLVVDDSDTARRFVASLLRLHLYQVLEAADGVHAIKLVVENPDLKLLIADYHMPRMDGCELVKNIRLKYEKTDLVVIGLSSETEGSLSARFIKNGANDFLRKPFNHEEFFCRISQNMDFLELIQSMRDSANRDELTGAYSRKYFFERGEQILTDARANGGEVSAVVIDLEDFQQINQRYGLDVGDSAMRAVTQEFNALFERFIYARAGGKKFYVLMPGLSNQQAVTFVEKVRQIICSDPIDVDDCEVNVTFSAGVSSIACESINELMLCASQCLNRAVEAGGDLVFGDD